MGEIYIYIYIYIYRSLISLTYIYIYIYILRRNEIIWISEFFRNFYIISGRRYPRSREYLDSENFSREFLLKCMCISCRCRSRWIFRYGTSSREDPRKAIMYDSEVYYIESKDRKHAGHVTNNYSGFRDTIASCDTMIKRSR